MALQQINLRVEESLLASLKVLAKDRGLSLNAAAAIAFENLLQGQHQASSGGDHHEQRLLKLEQRLAALEAKAKAAPAAAAPPSPKNPPTAAPTTTHLGDAITSADLAARLGMKRHAFNERVRRAGGAREGAVMEGWRCVGQTRPANGGPLQWLWRLD